MTCFDAYIFVDWSAANTPLPVNPAPDAPWVGEVMQDGDEPDTNYHSTRQKAVDFVFERLVQHIRSRRRVLLGFDFPYGYPKGLSAALGFRSGPPWQNIWAGLAGRIADTHHNNNNRFSVASDLNRMISDDGRGPFWGCPAGQATQHLNTHSPGFPFQGSGGISLKRLRLCERGLRGIQEVWKLYGPGSVGSQALTGIPRLHHLRHHPELCRVSKVWPFETGFTSSPVPEEGSFILHAEIWPGVVHNEVAQSQSSNPELIRDRAQVYAMCQWARDLDRRGGLGALFDKPEGLGKGEEKVCIEEEGWILGA